MSGQIAKSIKPLNQNVTPFDGNNTPDVIRELQTNIRDLQDAVKEIQSRQTASRFVDNLGLPQDGAPCEILDGQWIRLLQSAASPVVVLITHGLRRKPQGVIWVLSANANNQALISGVGNTPPANSTSLSIRLNGSIGDTHIGILF